MATTVRSFAKINLGLRIGPPRPDGFHHLCTLYQTIGLHDSLTVEAAPAPATHITIASNDLRVPTDSRNTIYRMLDAALAAMRISARVHVHLQKNLPMQGGLGAGSANAAATLLALERELGTALPGRPRLEGTRASPLPNASAPTCRSSFSAAPSTAITVVKPSSRTLTSLPHPA